MPRWKLLIVDDEALARSNLQLALADHPQWESCGLAASAAEARVAMTARPADLVLLDIQMPRQNGLSYAAELATLAEPPLVVFVTAHDEHALAAFEVHALDYLLKPFSDTRLSLTLQRAAQLQGERGVGLLRHEAQLVQLQRDFLRAARMRQDVRLLWV